MKRLFVKWGGVFSIVLLLISFLFAACSGGTDYVGGSSGGGTKTAESYTVTFETNGGSAVAAQTVEQNGTATEPSVPAKDGFIFGGWYTDSAFTSVFSFATKITANTTLYAKWINASVPTYTVSFETNGGSAVTSQTVESGGKASEPAAPTKDRGTFGGWYTDSAFTSVFSFTTNITANTTLYAKWLCTVTFDKNGSDATGTMAVKTDTQGATVTLPANSFKNGFLTVKKWNTAADGSGTAYADGADVVLSADMTLYAVWEYEFHETVTALDAGTNGTAGTSASYVYFGDFPNTVKASAVTVNESKTKTMGGFTYYLGSDGYWYAKCTENAYQNNYTYSDGTTANRAAANSEKYFRVEPIKWRVLTTDYNSTGKKLLLAENILTGNVKYYLDTTNRSLGANTVYPNNYKYSTIRAYLNGSYEADDTQTTTYSGSGFLQGAFTSSAQALIATTSVDNSAASTNPASNASLWNSGANQYASDMPTSDKIFLLSEKEATTSGYGFAEYDVYVGDTNGTTSSTRIRMTTDWAKANYAYHNSTAVSCGWWWLRSPYYNSRNIALGVDSRGISSLNLYDVDHGGDGVVPALCVD